MPIKYRDAVMFSNLGGQSLMQWAEFSPLLGIGLTKGFVAFCSFFPFSLTVFIQGRQQKSGGRQQKALELTNSAVFHRGRQ